MSGLVLALAPNESFIVNGAVLENGDKPSRVRIKDGNARVLRCSDALHPREVDTPVKQVYFAVHLLITGDLEEEVALPAIFSECDKLDDVFETIDRSLISRLRSMIERGNFYSALCHMRQIMAIEAELLALARRKAEEQTGLKVA